MKHLKFGLICGVIILLSVLIVTSVYGQRLGRYRGAPQVRNVSPGNDSEVIVGPEGVEFKWRLTPIPKGGRRAFRFRLFKGFEYGSIVQEELGHSITSITIPADVFKDSTLYSWEVSQCGQHGWSNPCHWSFTAKKK